MLSEQYFKSTTWPSVENIESMIPNGKIEFNVIALLNLIFINIIL
jgi:hypothetical protein